MRMRLRQLPGEGGASAACRGVVVHGDLSLEEAVQPGDVDGVLVCHYGIAERIVRAQVRPGGTWDRIWVLSNRGPVRGIADAVERGYHVGFG